MPYYIYDSEVDERGYHRIHKQTCEHVPPLRNRKMLGWFINGTEALDSVKKKTGEDNFNGCYYCCNECYKHED